MTKETECWQWINILIRRDSVINRKNINTQKEYGPCLSRTWIWTSKLSIRQYLFLTIKFINYMPITYLRREKKWKNATFTIAIAAETGSLTPRTVHTNELSEPAGIIPIGIDIPSFWLSLLRRPLRTYKPTMSYNLPIINDVCMCVFRAVLLQKVQPLISLFKRWWVTKYTIFVTRHNTLIIWNNLY